ncbi:MAG: OmpA family protein, partial [Nannocystis sp.]|nr:OmpA family protein [Nannocystis sp.]
RSSHIASRAGRPTEPGAPWHPQPSPSSALPPWRAWPASSRRPTATATALFDGWVALMLRHPGVRVEIAGHTDSREQSPAEQSLRRAPAVQRYMLAHGVAAARMQVRGAGADEPHDNNTTDLGRARNRRTTFTIIAPCAGERRAIGSTAAVGRWRPHVR